MEKPFVSVIIPAYNSSDYISSILKDILNQTYDKFEVIVVDDGSNDKTSKVVNEFCLMDKKIKYFYKDNGGASSARNFGIEHANGQYITFIDSDDHVLNDYLESMLSIVIKENYDFVSFLISSNYQKTIKKSPLMLMNNKDILESFFAGVFGIGPTSKLFKKDLIKELRFDENITINEDKLFVFEYLKKCTKAYCGFENKYYVIFRESSLSNSVNYSLKAKDLLYVQDKIDKESLNTCLNKRNHDVINTLYIFKVLLHLKDSKNAIQKSNIKQRVINAYHAKGKVCLKARLEYFLYCYFYVFYVFILKKYYKL